MTNTSRYVAAATLALCAAALLADEPAKPTKIELTRKWTGTYPVAAIDKLPEALQDSPMGYIGDAATWKKTWAAWQPGDAPEIDFAADLVVFVRNTQFFNAIGLPRFVTLDAGTLKVLWMETQSARPIEDRVSMGMFTVPRAGIERLDAGGVVVRIAPPEQVAPNEGDPK